MELSSLPPKGIKPLVFWPYQRLQVRGVLEAARKATLELPVPSAGLSSKGKKRLNVLNVLVTPGLFRGGLCDTWSSKMSQAIVSMVFHG